YISLADIIDRTLLDYYLDEICRLSCRISTPKDTAGLEFGDQSKVPAVGAEAISEVKTSPLPVDIPGGRVAGLFAKGEFVGYATVSVASESDVPHADFVFQLINTSLGQKVDLESMEFTVEYLKNLINLMQGMSQKASAVFDRQRVAELFIQECQKLFGASSGAVLVGGAPEGAGRQNAKLTVLAQFGEPFSDFDAVENAIDERKLQVAGNELMVVPLIPGQSVIGALYLKDKEIGPFSIEDQRMALTLGAVLGGTIANIDLHQSLVATERVKSTLSRYLSPNLLREVIEHGKFSTLGGKRMRTAILFTDIRGFTKMSEKISPERMVAQLNEYFEEMAQVIFTYDGTLDKFVGDMVMVVFGAPKPMLDASARAIRTAIDMQKRIRSLNKKWSEEGKNIFEVGMGINAGDVVFGNIGSSQAMGLTVIGDHVNQAQRLEAYAGAGEILVSEAVAKEVGENGFKFAKLGLVEVKGKQVVAYRVEYQ
ncbi:MAG: hypothetical protein HY075_04180, partial [Deltaproteobacteria bacterium]|nr:hypothetical protein [Deltaproteobacteria bacterium]